MDLDLDGSTLRQRTSSNSRPVRERSREPTPRVSEQEIDNLWESFKDETIARYPTVKFPDEYHDTDTVTSSVCGDNIDLREFVGKKSHVKFKIQQDGRVVIEFRAPVVPVPLVPPFLKSVKLWVIVMWVIVMCGTGVFVTLNLEKYKTMSRFQ